MNPILSGVSTVLGPNSIQEWVSLYKKDIRVIIHWEDLVKSTIKLSCDWHLGPQKPLPGVYFPWAITGHWMKGAKLKPVTLGNNNIIVRAPAVHYGIRTILLDGCHRISQLQPKLVLLDTIHCDSKTKHCFADLLFAEPRKGK